MKPNTTPHAAKQVLTTFGKILALSRKERKWRQEDMAKRIGVTRQTIARIEKGDAQVAAGHYFTAAWILDLPLFPGIESKTTHQPLVQLLELLKDKYPKRIYPQEKKIEDNF